MLFQPTSPSISPQAHPRPYLQAKNSFDPSLESLLESRFAGIPSSVYPL